MKYYPIILVVASFIYGLWALITGKLLKKDIESIAEKHKRLYARLIGVALTMIAIIGALFHFIGEDKLYSIVCQPVLLAGLIIFTITPGAILLISKKILKNK